MVWTLTAYQQCHNLPHTVIGICLILNINICYMSTRYSFTSNDSKATLDAKSTTFILKYQLAQSCAIVNCIYVIVVKQWLEIRRKPSIFRCIIIKVHSFTHT